MKAYFCGNNDIYRTVKGFKTHCLPCHFIFMSLFAIPKEVSLKFEKIQRNLLCGGWGKS